MKILIGIIIFLILVLFGLGIFYLVAVKHKRVGWLFSVEEVRGASITYASLDYTLDFDQQNDLVVLLNDSKKTAATLDHETNAEIEKITLYFFDKATVELTPLSEDYSLFSLSNWKKNEALRILQSDRLEELLNTAHDIP